MVIKFQAVNRPPNVQVRLHDGLPALQVHLLNRRAELPTRYNCINQQSLASELEKPRSIGDTLRTVVDEEVDALVLSQRLVHQVVHLLLLADIAHNRVNHVLRAAAGGVQLAADCLGRRTKTLLISSGLDDNDQLAAVN